MAGMREFRGNQRAIFFAADPLYEIPGRWYI
jgi:hypothetical protein